MGIYVLMIGRTRIARGEGKRGEINCYGRTGGLRVCQTHLYQETNKGFDYWHTVWRNQLSFTNGGKMLSTLRHEERKYN